MSPDALRRAALSRARQIANQTAPGPRADRDGIVVGTVLDDPRRALFLVVTRVAPGYLDALGIQQARPTDTFREVRLPASLLAFRLARGWLKVVPDRRR